MKATDSRDSGSLRALLLGMWIALLAAFGLAFVSAWAFPARLQVPLFAVGLTLILLGALLRRYCWRTLGEYFTGDVRARQNQPVIRSGPYRLIRHPSYTAAMMMFIGIGFALGNQVSLILLTIASIVAYGYRVKVEERVLLATIGDPYLTYMKECKRFIPYIVCLVALVLAPPAYAQSTTGAAATPIKLEDQWTSALVRRDTKTFDRLLAPNFVYTEDAAVMTRSDVMASVTGSDHVEWAHNEGMKLHDFGDVHVITGVLHLKGKGGKGRFDRRYQFTDTWQRRNGRWQIIAAQDYLIPK